MMGKKMISEWAKEELMLAIDRRIKYLETGRVEGIALEEYEALKLQRDRVAKFLFPKK